MSDEGNFLSRWSRRKLKAKQDAATDAPQAAQLPAVAPAAQPTAGPQLPVPESPDDGIGPEYREFFDPRVEEKLRRTALKKLFSDPHFNVMDGLDTYIDDYSKPDPIPEAMLRQLNQATNLFLFDEERKTGAEDGTVTTAVDAALPAPALERDAPTTLEAADASAATEPEETDGIVRSEHRTSIASAVKVAKE